MNRNICVYIYILDLHHYLSAKAGDCCVWCSKGAAPAAVVVLQLRQHCAKERQATANACLLTNPQRRRLCRRFKQLEDSSQISVILRLSMCL